MLWFMVAIIIIISVFMFVAFVKWRQTYWTRIGLKQLESEFFLGNFRKIVTGEVSMNDSFLDFYWQFKNMGVKHGGIYSILEAIYVPIDPALIKHILIKDFPYFHGHGFYHDSSDVLSMHLFNLEGEMWKRLRAKLTPTFSSGKIKMMLGTLTEKASGLQKLLDEITENNEPVQIKDVLSRYTIDVIGTCAFGIECNSLQDPDCYFRTAGLKALDMNLLHFVVVALAPWFLLRAIKFNFTPRDVTDFFSKIVRETIDHREKNNATRKDFMQLLIQMKNDVAEGNDDSSKGDHALTENEIVAQCFIFFLGGFETSSTTMTFVLLELAQNMIIQEKLRDQIKLVLSKHNGVVSYEAIKEMSYLEKVILETLRKYPPLATLPRRCNKDYQLPDTNIVLKKGTMVQIPVWGIHRDPEFYPNPDVFNPENFSEENKASRPDCTFLPFGEGPRMCIGLRFGMLQTKVGLISVLTRYQITMNPKTPLPVVMDKNFILSVKGDVWLNVTKI